MLVVVAEVELDAVPDRAWAPGPVVMRWRVGTPKEVASTATERLYYLNEGLEACLYRREHTPVRWHRTLSGVPFPGRPQARFDAVEVLRLPGLAGVGDRGLCAVHVSAGEASVDEAEALIYAASNLNIRHGAPLRTELDRLLAGVGRLAQQSRRAHTVGFVVPRSRLSKPFKGASTPAEQWLYLLANQARIPPSAEVLTEAAKSDIAVSEDYRARVTTFGISLVALKPATEQKNVAVHEAVEFFARGLYTDLLLFGVSRTVLLRLLSTRTTTALMDTANAGAVEQMRSALLWFRRLYVRSDFAPQPPYDQMLRQFSAASELDNALERVQKDVDDLATRLQARLSAQTNALLGLIAVIGLPFSLSVAIWADLQPSKLLWLLVAFGAATAVSLVLLFTTKARNLVRDLRPMRKRRD